MTLPLKTVAFADDDPGLQTLLSALIERSGYHLVGACMNGTQAITCVREKKPQLLLLDFHMPDMTGFDVIKTIAPLGTTAIVLMTGDADPKIAREAMDLGACGYLQKPMEVAQAVPIMETAWHRFETTANLKQEMKTLNETLETRKLVEKAKGILMEQQGFTEDAAHKMLQKMSQDQGLSIKDVCRSLIQVRMVLGAKSARYKKVV